MAEIFAELRGVLHGARAVGVHGHSGRGTRGEGHAQALGWPVDLLEKRASGRGRGVGVAQIGACGRVQQGGAVAHRACHGVLHHEAAEDVAVERTERVPAARGLEAEEPAARGGNADRPAAVVRVGHRDQTCCHGSGRPTARAARRAVEAPRIARGPEQPGLGDALVAELGRVRLAEHDEARAPQAPGQLTVGLGRVAPVQEGGAFGQPDARVFGEQVLEQERHTRERAVGWRHGRLGTRAVEHRRHDGVELGVQTGDARDRRLDQLDGLDGFFSHERGLRRCVKPPEITHDHLRGGNSALAGVRRQGWRPVSRAIMELI